MSKMGRPKGTTGIPQKMTKAGVVAMRKKAMEYAEEALQTMVAIMRDEENDAAVRLKASNDVLNRAYGTPVSTQIQHKIIEDERGSPISTGAISTAGTKDLEQLAAVLARFIEAERNTLDVTPAMPDGYPEG